MIKLQGPRYCPECKVDFTGKPIPEEQRQGSDDATHYSEVIGIEDPMIYDGIIMYGCYHCKHQWDAWNWRKNVHNN